MKRAKKVSISIQPDLLKALTRRAKRLYSGNISAVIAEIGEDVKRLDAMDRYIDALGVAPLTDKARAQLDAELFDERRAPPASARKRGASWGRG